MSDGEAFLRAFHAEYPGATSRAFARGGSYARLAATITREARGLDLACGDGALLALLGTRSVGLDVSREELALVPSGRSVVQGRAQCMPFADRSFDAVACHLAFMLFDEIEQVVGELARVLVPGGTFVAVLGGGPVGGSEDTFHRFLVHAGPHIHTHRLGDPRARSDAGWASLFVGWGDLAFERHEVDLGGTFDEVWDLFASSYELAGVDAEPIRRALLAEVGTGKVPCRVVTWFARAIRPSAI